MNNEPFKLPDFDLSLTEFIKIIDLFISIKIRHNYLYLNFGVGNIQKIPAFFDMKMADSVIDFRNKYI